MSAFPIPVSAEQWLSQIFAARSVAQGGIVRRQIADVERLIGRDRFLSEIRRRGFRAVENAGQFVIFCNRHPLHILE